MKGATGLLFGLRSQDTIRIVAARCAADAQDPRLAGFESIGMFALRERGEVFLTEDDLARFERSHARVALVIAASSAGFFMREPNGSIQSIKSHEEFPCPPPEPSPLDWSWLPLAAVAIVAIALATLSILHRPVPPLTVRQDADQLRITWAPAKGSIEIRDGAKHISFPIASNTSGATYAGTSGDIEIRLRGAHRQETARFIGPDPIDLQLARVRARIAELESAAAALRVQTAGNRRHIAGLERSLSTMKRAD